MMKILEFTVPQNHAVWLKSKGLFIEQNSSLYNIVNSEKEIVVGGLDQTTLIEHIADLISASANLYEMANLDSDTTGLPMHIFCSPKGNAKHECRIKVCNSKGKMNEDDTFSIAVKDFDIEGECRLNSDDLERVKWWIFYNRTVLLDYWKERINTKTFLNSVKNLLDIKVSSTLKVKE